MGAWKSIRLKIGERTRAVKLIIAYLLLNQCSSSELYIAIALAIGIIGYLSVPALFSL